MVDSKDFKSKPLAPSHKKIYAPIKEAERRYELQVHQLRFSFLLEELYFIFEKDKDFFKEQLRAKGLPESFDSFVDRVFKRRYATKDDHFTSVRRDLKSNDRLQSVQESHPLIDSDHISFASSVSRESLEEYINAVKKILDKPREGLFCKILRFLGIKYNKLGEIREHFRESTDRFKEDVSKANYTSGRDRMLGVLPSAFSAYKPASIEPPSTDELRAQGRMDAILSSRKDLESSSEPSGRSVIEQEEASYRRGLEEGFKKIPLAMKLQPFLRSKGISLETDKFYSSDEIVEFCHNMLLERAHKIKGRLASFYPKLAGSQLSKVSLSDLVDLLPLISDPDNIADRQPIVEKQLVPEKDADIVVESGIIKRSKNVEISRVANRVENVFNVLNGIIPMLSSKYDEKSSEPDKVLDSILSIDRCLQTTDDLLQKIENENRLKLVNKQWEIAQKKIPRLLKELINEQAKFAQYDDPEHLRKARNIQVYIKVLKDIKDQSGLRSFLDFLNQAIPEGTLHRIVAEDRERMASNSEYKTLIQLRDDLIKFDEENPKFLDQIKMTQSRDKKQEVAAPQFKDTQPGDYPDAQESVSRVILDRKHEPGRH